MALKRDEKLELILEHATRLFSRESYAATSIRDIVRDAEISLAGLYYHFKSKEEVLFTIQRDAFAEVLELLEEKLAKETDPKRRLAILVENHIDFFIQNMDAMKVLSHESESLNGEFHTQITAMKREYFKRLVATLEPLVADQAAGRTVAMSLFGAMNWIYNWYNPEQDGSAETLAAQMTELFLHGLCGHG